MTFLNMFARLKTSHATFHLRCKAEVEEVATRTRTEEMAKAK
jgi:hypothetical protein